MSRLDEMSNEEYQRLLRAEPQAVRARIVGEGHGRRNIERVLADLNDVEVSNVLRDLGGHDVEDLLEAYRAADTATDGPSVIFAYTIKAWKLPTEGHPSNHSALLTTPQWERLALDLGADSADPWTSFPVQSPEAEFCRAAARRLKRPAIENAASPDVPIDVGRTHTSTVSTQQAFGRFLVDVIREAPDLGSRIVTVSPDVASSTNLGGWINKVGIWNIDERVDWFSDDPDTILRWRESGLGQHIELGIAECNLVGLLGELGATWSREGQPLLPIGTLYDPFVTRALEQWSFGIYAGGQSILVGTPSGITLAPEGGAHQSIITPSIGLEQPGCVAWEPAFGQDLEWIMLHALGRLGRPDGTSSYFRLSTRPIDQDLAMLPAEVEDREERRRHVVEGGYLLRQSPTAPSVILVGMGAVMPEVSAAADALADAGMTLDLMCLTSPDLLFRALQSRRGFGEFDDAILNYLFPADRMAPIVTVLDGHPHTLAFLSGIHGAPITCLGVSDFGQVGDIDDLYQHFEIDTKTIIGSAWDLIEA
jgi:pyruvate dehydrogenase E1 component